MSLAEELAERADYVIDQDGNLDADALAQWLIDRGVGKRGGRRRSRRERPEAPEVGQAAKRFARALATRATEGDTEGLEQLVEVRVAVDDAIDTAARALHGFGYSWSEIGGVVGVTKQAAHKRFGTRRGEVA